MKTQDKARLAVTSYMRDCVTRTKIRRETLTKVYKAWSDFTQPKQNNWSSSFRVNKAHEVVEKVLPRMIAKDPKWLVSVRQERVESEWAEAIQDYLTYGWDEYNMIIPARMWAKSMVIDGKGYAKPVFKWETARTPSTEEVEVGVDELTGEPIYETQNTVSEEIIGQYATFEVKSWTDIYYDPRYVNIEDRPAIIEETRGVRFADLLRQKEKYMNLDKIRDIQSVSDETEEDFQKRVQSIAGITEIGAEESSQLRKNELTLLTYYGKFSPTDKPEGEKLYKITLVSGCIVIEMKEISYVPFEEIKCFEDPQTAFARGFVEPIIGLQDELNFKKNSASEYINKSLTRQVIWSSQSGIDPRTINDPVIITTKSAAEAQANFVELNHPQINSDYFQELNDIERQIQGLTFTVDASSPQSQQGMTQTATGIRVKFFESNSVIDEIRKHFEEGLEKLAYKLLEETFENMDDIITFKKIGKEGYWNLNKEVLRDALNRYQIKVEVNSSSWDYLENRREENVAWFNILTNGFNMGIVDETGLALGLEDVGHTFEKKDPKKYIKKPSVQQMVGGMAPGQPEGGGTTPLVPQAKGRPGMTPPAAQLTEAVAQGGITSAAR